MRFGGRDNMQKLIARSPAKINLTLDVLGVFPDGYHKIETVLQSIDLHDELIFEFEPCKDVEVALACLNSKEEFPLTDSNLIAKAAVLFFRSLPEKTGVKVTVTVDKNIPIAAGLAGGSSNAAATLRALNYFAGQPFSTEELLVLAGKLGADVPFCLEGGTCIGRGRGDELTPVEMDQRLFFLIAKPKHLAISTPWVYQTYDEFVLNEGREALPTFEAHQTADALESGDLETAAKSFGNVFEPIVFAEHAELKSWIEEMKKYDPWCAHMTGSGPTLYALVADCEMAHFMRRKMLEHPLAQGIEFFIAESSKFGAQLIGEH
jgi:4-diphosphocytidyl-2-C-methyl-D-erythritol kinase